MKININSILLGAVVVTFIPLILYAQDHEVISKRPFRHKNASFFTEFDQKQAEYADILNKIEYANDTLRLLVCYRELAPFACGYLSTASLTIGIDSQKDTTAVVCLCDMDTTILRNNEVNVLPCDSIPFLVGIIGKHNDTTFSMIRRYMSVFGEVQKLSE